LTNAVSLQYQGFRETPNLWLGAAVFGLQAYDYALVNPLPITDINHLPQRLGKRVEHFVSHELRQLSNLQLLAESLQIQRDKQTIGELDALIQTDEDAIHLEIVYKFYLYDPTVGSDTLDHWIGPNRNDSLVQKLDKLQNKQFPLLYHACTKPYLEELQLTAANLRQQVLFKAQLFVPYDAIYHHDPIINDACITGYYLKKDQLPSFRACRFYVPKKLDWLVRIHSNVAWLSYEVFSNQLFTFLDNGQSPMVWVRYPDGSLKTCFVVWW